MLICGWLYILSSFLPITLSYLPIKSHSKTLWLLWLGPLRTDSRSDSVSASAEMSLYKFSVFDPYTLPVHLVLTNVEEHRTHIKSVRQQQGTDWCWWEPAADGHGADGFMCWMDGVQPLRRHQQNMRAGDMIQWYHIAPPLPALCV